MDKKNFLFAACVFLYCFVGIGKCNADNQVSACFQKSHCDSLNSVGFSSEIYKSICECIPAECYSNSSSESSGKRQVYNSPRFKWVISGIMVVMLALGVVLGYFIRDRIGKNTVCRSRSKIKLDKIDDTDIFQFFEINEHKDNPREENQEKSQRNPKRINKNGKKK